MLVLIGWIADGTPMRAPLWMSAGLVALAVHEFAHARVARRGGATPLVELSWRGGLTRWYPPDQLPPLTEARVLLAGPLVGLALALLADRAATLLTGTSIAANLGAQWLSILTGVSIVLAVVDLLPIFPRDGARILLLLLPGPHVLRVVRVAMVGAVTAAMAAGALLASPWPELALVPGFLVLTNTWLAVRGDRAIGRPAEEAIAAHDWTSVRRRLLEGCDSVTLVAAAQQEALDCGDYAEAADIGDAALSRGWHTIGFATRTAIARLLLEQDDRAMTRVQEAVALGADPDDLARTTPLGRLRHRFDWPEAVVDLTAIEADAFVVDLRETAPDSA